MKRYIYSVALVFVSGVILSCAREERATEKEGESAVTVTVTTPGKKWAHFVQSSGQVVSGETAMISTRMMGYITAIKVKPGDKVQKGQLLVTISNGDILAKRAQARAMLLEAEAALHDAQKDLERYTELFKQQSASQKELENVTLSYDELKAKTEAARQMQNEADAMLTYTNITAPFAGVVTQKNVDAGSMANPGVPILILEQSGSFHVNTSVTEADIDLVRSGADARVTIESIQKTLMGKIYEVSPSSQMSGGQYQVKVGIPGGEKIGLHSGMYAKVSIEVPTESGNADNPVMVPASAIVSKDQLTGLYTISDGKTALLRWVTLGKRQNDQVEVLSGLSSNENFIVTADGKLYNGVPVIVK